MADDQLRQLERRFRETGSLPDEAEWLQARLRYGEVTADDLSLAAWLGSRAAKRVLAADALRPPHDLEAWAAGLKERWPAAALRASLAATRHGLLSWERTPERCARHGTLSCKHELCTVDLGPRRICEVCERCAISSHAPEAVDAVVGVIRDVPPVDEDHYGFESAALARAARSQALAIVQDHGSDAQVELVKSHYIVHGYHLVGTIGPLDFVGRGLRHVAEEEARARSVDLDYLVGEALHDLRRAIGEDLIPWVLGLGDPLAERTQAAPTVVESTVGDASDRQTRHIQRLAFKAALNEDAVLRRVEERTGKHSLQALDKREASALIDELKEEARLQQGGDAGPSSNAATARQMTYIWRLAEQANLSHDEVSRIVDERAGGKDVHGLDKRGAAKVIDALRDIVGRDWHYRDQDDY